MQALHESLLEVGAVFEDCAKFGIVRSIVQAGEQQMVIMCQERLLHTIAARGSLRMCASWLVCVAIDGTEHKATAVSAFGTAAPRGLSQSPWVLY